MTFGKHASASASSPAARTTCAAPASLGCELRGIGSPSWVRTSDPRINSPFQRAALSEAPTQEVAGGGRKGPRPRTVEVVPAPGMPALWENSWLADAPSSARRRGGTAGMTTVKLQALAKALRAIRDIAAKALKENDLPPARGRRDRFTEKQKRLIRELDSQYLSATKIARKLGVSQPGVSAFLRREANDRIRREMAR